MDTPEAPETESDESVAAATTDDELSTQSVDESSDDSGTATAPEPERFKRRVFLDTSELPRAKGEPLGLRIVRGLGWASITVGLLILGFVAHQLWVTDFFAEQNQGALEEARDEHFSSVSVEEVVVIPGVGVFEPGDLPPDIDPRENTLRLLREESPEEGTPFATIRIPALENLQEGWTIVEGIRLRDLKNGAGHMPFTPLPGQPGNAVISGHRTTYGAPFHNVDELVPGDRIEVETAIGVHVYEVRSLEIVEPTALWVTDPREGAWLTLTTCHPKFSARQRLIVFAEMVDGPNFDVLDFLS